MWTDYLHQTILIDHPGARPGIDFTWAMTEEGPAMTHWDEDVMGGAFVLSEWEDKCIAVARELAVARINAMHAAALEAATGDATTAERDTWAVKALAASAYAAGAPNEAQAALIDGEAEAAGESVAVLLERISAKATAFHLATGRLSGIRRKALADLAEATSTESFDAIIMAAETAFEGVGNG